jgi:hypothetical protein
VESVIIVCQMHVNHVESGKRFRFSTEVENAWSHTSTPQCVLMVWCSVKHRDNSTFTFKRCHPCLGLKLQPLLTRNLPFSVRIYLKNTWKCFRTSNLQIEGGGGMCALHVRPIFGYRLDDQEFIV